MAAPLDLGRAVDVRAQTRKDDQRLRVWFLAMLAFCVVSAAIAYSTMDRGFSLALVLMIVCTGVAFLRPTVGVYVIVVLTLIGDTVTNAWWPFTKNLSSHESVLFLSDGISINPLEILLAVTAFSWFLRRLVTPSWRFVRGRLLLPILVFTGFVALGFIYGQIKGGDRRVAIFEARPFLYIAVVYILITNLFTSRAQYKLLVQLSCVAISIQAIFALVYYRDLPEIARKKLDSLSEHSATVHMNSLFVFALAVCLFRCRKELRWFALVLLPPVIYAYFLSQRRAAMVAMFIGIVILAVMLWYRRRRMFWAFVPATLILGSAFVTATWNATGGLGLPAQAVKTVLFPDQLSAEDTSSDLYRITEAFNLSFTIRANPIFGQGFGRKFLMPAQMPDISFFEFWEYIPHNNVLWIWIKMGFGGFAAMFYLWGRAMQHGARAVMQVRRPDQLAVVAVGVTYVLMFVVFAYVDIAWDPRSTVFLGVCFAICADFVGASDGRAPAPAVEAPARAVPVAAR